MGLPASYDCSVSTTWTTRRVKLRQSPKAPRKPSPEAAARRKLAPWSRRDRLTVVVTYRGGAECWYEVKARGCVWCFPGWLDIETVMACVYNDV